MASLSNSILPFFAIFTISFNVKAIVCNKTKTAEDNKLKICGDVELNMWRGNSKFERAAIIYEGDINDYILNGNPYTFNVKWCHVCTWRLSSNSTRLKLDRFLANINCIISTATKPPAKAYFWNRKRFPAFGQKTKGVGLMHTHLAMNAHSLNCIDIFNIVFGNSPCI